MALPLLPSMRAAQVRSMMDKITITPRTVTTSTTGDERLTNGTPIPNVACGFAFEAGGRKETPDQIALEWDATLRLPWDRALGERDLITLTSFRGAAWSENFEIVKMPEKGGTAQNVLVRRVVR